MRSDACPGIASHRTDLDPRKRCPRRRETRIWLGIGLSMLLCRPLLARGTATAGILPFANETGDPAQDDLARETGRRLQQRLVTGAGEILARVLEDRPTSDADAAATVPEAAAFGRERGVEFLVRGGVLATAPPAAKETTARVVLYADVITTASGKVIPVRTMALPPEEAIRHLAIAVHKAIASTRVADHSEVPPGDPAFQSAPPEEEAAAPGEEEGETEVEDSDETEELQQLLAEAEGSLESSLGTPDQRADVQAAVQQLYAALERRATALEQEPSEESETEAETEMSDEQERLEEAVGAVRDSEPGEEMPVAGESSFSIQTFTTLLDSALQVIGRIQEMRSARRSFEEEIPEREERESDVETGASGGASAEGEVEEDEEPAEEESLEDVTGAVTQDGSPVEGATVTEPLLGISATTGADGSYSLRGVPSRMSSLVVSRGGKVLARGKVDVVRGRRALADFRIRTKSGSSTLATVATPGILASAVSVRPHGGASGVVSGTVQDPSGRPVPRALVTLPGLAAARTDSQGRYVFRNVPVGAHQLLASREGQPASTSRVQVTSGANAVALLRSEAAPARASAHVTLRDPKSRTLLSGTVTDEQNRPISGARVLAASSGKGLAAHTRSNGAYAIHGLRPGSYRVVATKVGYQDATQTVTVSAAAPTVRHGFRLGRTTSQTLLRVAATGKTGQIEIRGRVVGADRKAVSGARVSFEKPGHSTRLSSLTAANGSYQVRLSAGTYRLRASKSGKSSVTRNLTVGPGKSMIADLVLLGPSTNPQRAPTPKERLASNRLAESRSVSRPQTKAQPTRWQIHGRVTEEGSGRGIGGATISLSHTRYATSPTRTTRSDGDGSYAFEIETEGTFRLRAAKSGFMTEEKPVRLGTSRSVSVDLRLRNRQSPPRPPSPKSSPSPKRKPTPSKGGPK